MKKLLFSLFLFMGIVTLAEAQVSAGINFQNTRTFITVGSDTDKEFFGEGRLGLGDDLGLELMGGYNFVRKSEVNAYFGFGLGLFGDHHRNHKHDHDDVYLAIPFGVLIKPFDNKNFGFLIEAAPVFADNHDGYLRGGIGFKYTFR
ncbi:outer membrane insertion C- signal [Algoriphagus sp. AK58]|uniref:outer membrane insertion C- signal n=1 Tax=Algoriphagus sp. AK58 TaxID=1406877 RepID=UPI001650BB9E|nr:outer membrane insertion C- signal [Algoriphagus sp. AK58]MBC6367769.1 outer membrane insertion C- signal [Algoriphagus sp. AK58]